MISNTLWAQTSLWQISNDQSTLYLGGTIHVLSQSDYPLPKEFDSVFSKVDKVVFETDIGQAKTADFAIKMMQKMRYPNGQSIKNVLEPETYKRLSNYFSSKMTMDMINQLKPGMIALMITAMEFQRIGMIQAGVDEFYWKKAELNKKEVATFETVDEQINYIANMGIGHENELINNILDEIEKIEALLVVLKKAWRKGDLKSMRELILDDMIDQFPELYQTLLVERNQNWLPKIDAWLTDSPKELILVGTLHLIGEQGLLKMLENKGYKVKQYDH